MSSKEQLIDKIKELQINHSNSLLEYWFRFSFINTWQFWLFFALLIIPLIAIYKLIDKKRAMLIGFFGFNVHVWFTYMDLIGGSRNFWFYPYKVVPFLPTSFPLDVSFVPVCYMFFYQWTLHRKKNYYLYMLVLCMLLSFVFEPILVMLGLIELNKGTTYFHLLLGYTSVALISKIITNIFIKFENISK